MRLRAADQQRCIRCGATIARDTVAWYDPAGWRCTPCASSDTAGQRPSSRQYPLVVESRPTAGALIPTGAFRALAVWGAACATGFEALTVVVRMLVPSPLYAASAVWNLVLLILTLVMIAGFVVSVVGVCAFSYASGVNLQRRTGKHGLLHPIVGMLSWLVPIVNLVLPALYLVELRNRSDLSRREARVWPYWSAVLVGVLGPLLYIAAIPMLYQAEDFMFGTPQSLWIASWVANLIFVVAYCLTVVFMAKLFGRLAAAIEAPAVATDMVVDPYVGMALHV